MIERNLEIRPKGLDPVGHARRIVKGIFSLSRDH